MEIMELRSGAMNTPNGTCTLTESRAFLVHCSFPIAIVMILILSFVQRTKKERRSGNSSWFRDNFSLIYPIDLYDNHDRLAYCLAFGASSTTVLDLLFNDYTAYLFHYVPPGWSKILVGSILTIEISIDCFPTFACITSKARLLSNAMGFVYNAFWFIMLVLMGVGCAEKDQVHQSVPYPQIITQIPVLICLFLLCLYFLFTFIRIAKQRYEGIKITPQEKLMKSHQAVYVKNLLRAPKEVVYTGWRARVFKNYKPHPGFKYPTRLFMACTVSVAGLYQVAFWLVVLGVKLIDQGMGLITEVAMAALQQMNNTAMAADVNAKLEQTHTTLTIAWYIASGFAIVLPLSYIPGILKNYRTQLLSIYAGRSQLPPHKPLKSVDYLVGSLKYIGFQVALFLSGYMGLQAFLFLVFGGVSMLILAITWNVEAILLNIILELALPSAVIGISVMTGQSLLVRHVFTQDKLYPEDEDRPLALQHRVWFLIFSYVAMFLNILYGIIMSIIRLLIGIISLIVYLPRIDVPILMPGIDDLIYSVYTGNMYTDNAHSNPILVTFCHLMIFDVLRPQMKFRKLKRLSAQGFVVNQDTNSYSDIDEETDEETEPIKPVGLFKYFRWHLAYTLINNPSLIQLRKRPTVSQNEEVTVLNGELKVVSVAAYGGAEHKMLPHMVEVMKRHQIDKKKSSFDSPVDLSGLLLDDIQPELVTIEVGQTELGRPSASNAPQTNAKASPYSAGAAASGAPDEGTKLTQVPFRTIGEDIISVLNNYESPA